MGTRPKGQEAKPKHVRESPFLVPDVNEFILYCYVNVNFRGILRRYPLLSLAGWLHTPKPDLAGAISG